jgi:hypothetical protein
MAVIFAIVLVFESGLLSNSTVKISRETEVYLANVIGMSASVQPTELNQYTAALTEKERELENREASLKEREISINLSNEVENNKKTTYILASILFILLILILLNYTLDYLRTRESQNLKTV